MRYSLAPTSQKRVFFFFLALSIASMLLGNWFTSFSVHDWWYRHLEKPFWTPPNWAFGVIWPIMYILMAISAWRVWRINGFFRKSIWKEPLGWYYLQLGLNTIWSFFFFTLQMPFLALVNLLILFVTVAVTNYKFWKKEACAGWIFLPYSLWTLYALALNIAIVLSNSIN